MSKRSKGRGRGRFRDFNPSQNPTSTPGEDVNDFPPLTSLSDVLQNVPGMSSDFPPLSAPAGNGNGRGRRKNKGAASVGEKKEEHEQKKDEQRNVSITGRGITDESDKASKSEQSVTSKIDIKFTDSEKDNERLCNSKFPKRPGFGSAGRKIDLISNYFGLKSKVKNIYHYDVEITSLDQVKKYGRPVKKMTAAEAAVANISHVEHQLDKNIGKNRCQEIFDRLITCKKLKSFNPVYDGNKNMFTSAPLPQEFDSTQSFTVELENLGKTRNYEVVIQPVKKKNGTNYINVNEFMKQTYEGRNEAIMALNSILNHRTPPSSQVQIGRSFFFLNQARPFSLGEGLEIWYGYNQSVHLTQVGPAVVINLSAKAFHKAGPIIDYASEVIGRDITRGTLSSHDIKRIEEALKRVRVSVTHLKYPRKYYVDGISKLSARDLRMNFDGREITIANYFHSKYGALRFPHLPCLFMRTPKNQTYIPFEHCRVMEGQPKIGKLNPVLGGRMIKQTAIMPCDRFSSIGTSAQDVQKQSGEKMRNYNVFMDLNPLQVKGRVISAPALAYHDKSFSNPDERGVWRMDGKNFFKTTLDIGSWVLICFSHYTTDKSLEGFADILTRNGRRLGLHLNKFLGIRRPERWDNATKVLTRAAEVEHAAFAMIVLNRKDEKYNYDEIKFIADYKLGFVTQCIEDKVLQKFNDQIANNLCLKINTKLGGVNHILQTRPMIFSKPFMVFGADAVHSPRGMGCPSIAAVVGSLDAYPSKYKVACRVQENVNVNKVSQELILEIKDMVKSILTAFYHNTKGKYPERIIFFRDGVSEGQFKKVRDYEVSAIQEASRAVIGCIVPITFIIVQKRHQTRFRPRHPSDGVGRGRNVPPGTTVDADVTDPEYFDYFLNSHEGIQGTSKPAHYTVLHDDNKFDSDTLQELSYHLCYTYSKCNRSISIPPPVMYADLACYRAKKYADFHIQKERDNVSVCSDSSCRLPDHVKEAINKMGDYKTSMFFV